MKSPHSLVLGFLLLLATLLPAFAADPKVSVTPSPAKWTDGSFYMGTVTGVSGAGADVLYEDSDKLTVPVAEVFTLSQGRRQF